MESINKKRKILLATRPLVPPWNEASKNFAYVLAKSIRDPELEFHLLTTDEKLEGLGDNCIQHPVFKSARFDFEAKARLSLFLFSQSHRFDIVHFLFTPTPFNSFLLKNFTWKRPATIQTIATLREERWGKREWKNMFFADRLVTYTDHSKQKLEEVGFSNVERIYPGIDLEQFAPRPKNPETLTQLNLSPNDFIVSYVGEYARLGATDMIVEMLVKHLPKNTTPHRHSRENGNPVTTGSQEIRTDLVRKNDILGEWNLDPCLRGGDGIKFLFALRVKNDADRKKKEEIKEKLQQAGILDHVRFSDTVSDVAVLYNIADIITFPVADMHGKFDIPLVVLEAYASAKPVILSDLPTFKEFSNNDISATIPRGDGEALWNKITEMRENSYFSKNISVNALAFVKKYFNLKDTAELYRLSYQNLKV